MENIEVLNRAFFLLLNASDKTPLWLLYTATMIAEVLIYFIPLLFVSYWLWGDVTYRSKILEACAVTMIALGLNQMISMFWYHPRPFMIELGHTWLSHTPDSSFPSDHMTVFVGVGLTLMFGGMRTAASGALVAGCAAAWARIFLGLHFPLDMVGSLITTSISYCLVHPLWKWKGDTVVALAEYVYKISFAKLINAGIVNH